MLLLHLSNHAAGVIVIRVTIQKGEIHHHLIDMHRPSFISARFDQGIDAY